MWSKGTDVQKTRYPAVKNSSIINAFNILRKPPESISVFRALVGNTKGVFTMFWFCINCTNFVWLTLTGAIFQKPHTWQRCRCKISKRFSNFRPPQLPRQRSANSYKTLERSVTRVRHRELSTSGLFTRGAVPIPPGQPRGICSRCQPGDGEFANFIAARGLGISEPRCNVTMSRNVYHVTRLGNHTR